LLKTEQLKRNAAELKLEAEQVRELIAAQVQPIGAVNLEKWQRIAQFYLRTNLVSPIKTLSPNFVFDHQQKSSAAASIFSSPISYALILLILFVGIYYLYAKAKRNTLGTSFTAADALQVETLDPIEEVSSRHRLLDNLKQAVLLADQSHNHCILFFIEFGNLRELVKAAPNLSEKLILTELSKRIKEGLMGGDVLARQAQDEFALIVGGVDSAVLALEVVEALRSRLKAPLLINHVPVLLSIRMGFAVYQVDATTSEELMKIASRGMFSEKFQSLN
jgi:GGDEF domain-containing protein